MVFLHLHNPPVNHHSAVVWCISFLLPLAQPAMPAAASRKLTRSRESHPCAGLVHYFWTAKLLQNLADMSEANSFNLINLLGIFLRWFCFLTSVHCPPQQKNTWTLRGSTNYMEKCVCCLLKTKVHGETTEHRLMGLWTGSEWSGCVVGSISLFSEWMFRW